MIHQCLGLIIVVEAMITLSIALRDKICKLFEDRDPMIWNIEKCEVHLKVR